MKKTFITLAEVSSKLQRRADRHGQRVDGGDPLVRVDEQPFPVERHHLDPDRAAGAFDRRGRIELMRADPGDAAEQDHGERRDRPDHQLDPAGMGPVGQIDARADWTAGTTRRRRRSATMVGSTIASMIAMESIRMVLSAAPIGPCGSRMFIAEPLDSNRDRGTRSSRYELRAGKNVRCCRAPRRGHFTRSCSRELVHK